MDWNLFEWVHLMSTSPNSATPPIDASAKGEDGVSALSRMVNSPPPPSPAGNATLGSTINNLCIKLSHQTKQRHLPHLSLMLTGLRKYLIL
jgi:hypothetical protein